MKKNDMKYFKKYKSIVRFILSKELLNKKSIEELKDNDYIKEKIENYFNFIRLNIIEIASTYKSNTNEDFTRDIINGIFSEKEIFCQMKDKIITNKDLLDIYGEEKVDDFFINPINAYKEAADEINALYEEAYKVIGEDGIKAVFISIPRVLENNNFNINEIRKVTDDVYEEAYIINTMVANMHNIDFESKQEDFFEELSADFKIKQEDEERKIFCTTKNR